MNQTMQLTSYLKEKLTTRPQFLDSVLHRGQGGAGGGSGNERSGNEKTPTKRRGSHSLVPPNSELIDQKSLFEADNTILECEALLARSSEGKTGTGKMLRKLSNLKLPSAPSMNMNMGMHMNMNMNMNMSMPSSLSLKGATSFLSKGSSTPSTSSSSDTSSDTGRNSGGSTTGISLSSPPSPPTTSSIVSSSSNVSTTSTSTGIGSSNSSLPSTSSSSSSSSSSLYVSMMSRLANTEISLKHVVDEAVDEESSLTMQALHLTVRVSACIAYNKVASPSARQQLEEAMEVQREVEEGLRLLQAMVKFQSELNHLKEAQTRYVPKCLQVESTEPAPDPADSPAMIQVRLKKLNKLSAKLNRHVATLSRICNQRETNLSNLTYSNTVLGGMLAREGYSQDDIQQQVWMNQVMGKGGNKGKEDEGDEEEEEEEEGEGQGGEEGEAQGGEEGEAQGGGEGETAISTVEESGGGGGGGSSGGGGKESERGGGKRGSGRQLLVYDHSQCSDCSCVHTMVTECLMQLAAKSLQAEEGTRRLQRILELKSKLEDNKAQLMDLD